MDIGAIAEICHVPSRSYGSGYLIAPSLVITSRHVLGPLGTLQADPGWQVRLGLEQRKGGWQSARLVWSSDRVDLALLASVESAFMVPAPISRPRFGTVGREKRPCRAVGFPRFMDNEADRFNDSYELEGLIRPFTGVREGRLHIEVVSIPPLGDATQWQGMSGSAVFCDDELVAIITECTGRFGTAVLGAQPIESATGAEEFRALVSGATERPLRMARSWQASTEVRRRNKPRVPPSPSSRAIYLHFLDPELLRSVNLDKLDPSSILATIVLSSYGTLYCPLSFVWEGPFSKDLSKLQSLISYRHIILPNKYADVAEFLDSREALYSFDKKQRAYVSARGDKRRIQLAQQAVEKKLGDTAATIARQVLQWARAYSPELESKIGSIIRTRDGRALTRALFEVELGHSAARSNTIDRIHRQISLAFTHVYVRELDGDIISGIPSLGFFDVLSKQAPFLDFILLFEVVELVLGRAAVHSVASSPRHFDSACAARGTPTQVVFSNLVTELISCIMRSEKFQPTTSRGRHRLRGKIVRSLATIAPATSTTFHVEALARGCDTLRDAVANFGADES